MVIRAKTLILTLAITLALTAAASAQTPSQAQRDKTTIAFFVNHPRLAKKPEAQQVMWAILARMNARLRSLQSSRIPETSDWLTAVKVVQRVYPGSSGWLISCSASEGGHGGWVPNRQGSGAGGWMQFLSGTFWRMYVAARADASARGFRVPASSAAWDSPIGQALAGGWGWTNGRRGEWMGAGC